MQSYDRLLIIGHGSPDVAGNAEFVACVTEIALRVDIPVEPCFLECVEPSIAEGIRRCAAAGAQKIGIIPIFLGAAGHQKNDIAAIIQHAREEYPALQFDMGAPIGVQHHLVEAVAQRAAEACRGRDAIPLHETAILIVARGSSDPDSNAEVYKLSRMVYEGRGYGWVEVAFQKVASPNVDDGIERCVRLGSRRVVVVPYILFTGFVRGDIEQRTHAAQTLYPEIDIVMAKHLFPHESLIAAILQRYDDLREGMVRMTCDLCKYRHQMVGFEDDYGAPQVERHHHHGHGHDHDHGHHHRSW